MFLLVAFATSTTSTPNERMRITSAGLVGIGITSPSEALEIQNGAAGAKIKVSNSGGGYASLECSSNATSVTQLSFTNQLALMNGNVLINTTTDVASSKLTIDSTTQGVLVPRMTTTQINAIGSPANGLIAYNTTLAVLCFYDGTGWKKVSHSNM